MKWYEKIRILKRLSISDLKEELSYDAITELQKEVELLKTENKKLNDRIHNTVKWATGLIEGARNEMEAMNETWQNILKHFNVSADIGETPHHKNWMVFSIQGRQNYVAFRDMSERDIREIAFFLKRFEGCNLTIGAPRGMGDMFFHVDPGRTSDYTQINRRTITFDPADFLRDIEVEVRYPNSDANTQQKTEES